MEDLGGCSSLEDLAGQALRLWEETQHTIGPNSRSCRQNFIGPMASQRWLCRTRECPVCPAENFSCSSARFSHCHRCCILERTFKHDTAHRSNRHHPQSLRGVSEFPNALRCDIRQRRRLHCHLPGGCNTRKGSGQWVLWEQYRVPRSPRGARHLCAGANACRRPFPNLMKRPDSRS